MPGTTVNFLSAVLDRGIPPGHPPGLPHLFQPGPSQPPKCASHPFLFEEGILQSNTLDARRTVPRPTIFCHRQPPSLLLRRSASTQFGKVGGQPPDSRSVDFSFRKIEREIQIEDSKGQAFFITR